MTTHPTLEDARQAADRTIRCILEVEMESGERAYLKAKAPLAVVRQTIQKSGKGLPGVRRLVAQHDVLTVEQIAAERHEALRHKHCERCGAAVDGNTAYQQQEWTRFGGQPVRVATYYCDPCRVLLQAIGAGEFSAMQERAGVVPSTEPHTKED